MYVLPSSPSFFPPVDTRLLRSALYYLSPKKLMRKNMKDITFQLDIRDMECLELLDGMSPFFSLVFLPPLLSSCSCCLSPLNLRKSKSKTTNSLSLSLHSAEAVASMINAHIFGKSWTPPGWLPKRYLTWATEA